MEVRFFGACFPYNCVVVKAWRRIPTEGNEAMSVDYVCISSCIKDANALASKQRHLYSGLET